MFSVDRFWPQAQPAGWQRWMLHEAEFAAERRAGPQLYLARLPGQARLRQLLSNFGCAIPTLYKQYSGLSQPGGVHFDVYLLILQRQISRSHISVLTVEHSPATADNSPTNFRVPRICACQNRPFQM